MQSACGGLSWVMGLKLVMSLPILPPHLLNDNVESLYGDGGRGLWLEITWVCVHVYGEGTGHF